MNHSFNIHIATRYGVHAAVLLNNLEHWIAKNRANGKHYYDGNYWTYNSRRAFAELFPYMNARQIDYALKKLIDDGVIITGNFNQIAYDRTLWYAITKKGYCILQNCEMENTKLQNGNNEIVQPIPDVNISKQTDINTDNKRDSVTVTKVLQRDANTTSKTTSRFTPPTLSEVENYCFERNNNVDATRFVDYYTSNGWKVGKNAMKDWKAAVRTWERSESPKAQHSGSNTQAHSNNPFLDIAKDEGIF